MTGGHSDILAELDLPASGITRYEELYSLAFPKGVTLGDFTTPGQNEMMIYYSAQVQLRRILNRVHSLLYQPDSKPHTCSLFDLVKYSDLIVVHAETKDPHAGWSTTWCDELDHQLEEWRRILPEDYQWSDSDPPPRDINAARMRAKYYGAKYIIHRPFLHFVLHPNLYVKAQSTQLSASPTTSFPPTSYHASQPDPSNAASTANSLYQPGYMGPPGRANISEVPPMVMHRSELCVKAAIQSTIAFDGVYKRPIVTNIFGTAHA